MNWKHKSTLNLSILTFILRKLVLLAETRQQQLPKQILLKSVNYEVRLLRQEGGCPVVGEEKYGAALFS